MGTIDYQLIRQIDERFGSPFYLMDSEKYQQNISSFLAAFRKRYPQTIAGYSFKTNYVPALCVIAKNEGCFAEVVSEMELDLAVKLGFENIIFNGPIKRLSALQKAIKHHAIINIDSAYEVDFICQYVQGHPNADLHVGLRVNVHLADAQGRSTVQCGLREGRFGFPHDILAENIHKLQKAGLTIESLHGHTSSSDRAAFNYMVITDYMLSVCEEFMLNDLRYFDIGGGFFGAAPEGLDVSGRPTYEDYAKTVLGLAMKNAWFMNHRPYVVIEPGSSVVSNVFTYYTKTYQIKHIGLKNFVLVDGTVFDVKPTMHSNNLPHKIISNRELQGSVKYDVVGSTCMEKDVILRDISLPEMKAGDYIEIRGVGAYTIALTPIFINYLPPIVSIDDEIKVVRRRQELDDVIKIYQL